MNSDSNINNTQNQNKQLSVKLEWIFGIRNDITPNMFMLDNETLVYPAGHYIVIFNYTKKVPPNQIQQFIVGTPHSKGRSYINIRILNS